MEVMNCIKSNLLRITRALEEIAKKSGPKPIQHGLNRTTVIVNGQTLHLVLGKSIEEWNDMYANNNDFWNIPLEEFLDSSLYPNEDIWYWLINGRCYETNEPVKE